MLKKEKNTIHDIFAGYFEDPDIKKIAYWVSKKLEQGNICLDTIALEKEENILINIDDLYSNPLVTKDPDSDLQPFVILNNKIYFHRYFKYETQIIDKINTLIFNSNQERYKERLRQTKDFVFSVLADFDQNRIFFPWDKIAILNSVINNFSIITGGPGTGKTTTITKFLAIILKIFPNTSIALAAPTGKAVARMNQSILNAIGDLKNMDTSIVEKLKKLNAKTIHRLLGYIPNSPYFKHNKDNRLKYDIIIVDESSMIDAALMAKLLEAVKDSSKLILLGDKNQLASVEAGSIFGDLCSFHDENNLIYQEDAVFYNEFFENKLEALLSDFQSIFSKDKNLFSNYIIELQHSYRFDENQGIGKLSKLVISGLNDRSKLIEPFRKCTNEEECAIIEQDYSNQSFIEMLKYYEEYAKEEDIVQAFSKLNKIITLCALREGEYGYKKYNRKIENHLKNKKLINPSDYFYDKQPIMVTSNNYNLGVFNGDIGIVRMDSKGEKRVYFLDEEDKIKDYPVFEFNQIETAFATTIHKSQGSEYENVLVVLPDDKSNKVLSRELLYTAITRAKKKVIIYAKDDVIQEAVGRNIERISGIRERL